MGLYLCVFDGDEDVNGVEVGPYADFNALRDYIVRELEGGKAGSRFPVLNLHSDSDGEWSFTDCEKLRGELAEIATALNARPAIKFVSDWQKTVAKSIGLVPRNAFESFIDVDGEFLIERMQNLVDYAQKRGVPILFQ
jgi:hypothetical protein